MDKTLKTRSANQSYDWKLVICYVLLVIIGWVNIYASVHSSEPSSILDWSVRSGKQFVWILSAFGLAGLIMFVIPSRLWEGFSVFFYVFMAFLLVAVIFFGAGDVKGSLSWFEFGPVRFQPAEVSKISTSLLLAYIISRFNLRMSKIKDFCIAAAVIALPMLIIVAEKETGSALVYAGFIFMLYREGMTGWILTLGGLVVLLFIVTLKASPFASILLCSFIVTLCDALNSGSFWKWLTRIAPFLLFFIFLPSLYSKFCEFLMPGVSYAFSETSDPWVSETILRSCRFPFLLKIKPLYILLSYLAILLPLQSYSSYKDKNLFRGLSVATLALCLCLSFSVDFFFNNVLQPHQRNRIEVLLGITEDPMGVGYNVNQSMIAIGSGGLTGKGFLNGTQTTFGFVPEQSTDFIFCTVGEEWGFLGSFIVIFLYVFMIYRIILDAEHGRESFTRIYGYCVSSCLFMHLFINIGMTIGLMPVIGIPLPLLSYGGSSLWSFTAMIFIFIVLDHQEKKYF